MADKEEEWQEAQSPACVSLQVLCVCSGTNENLLGGDRFYKEELDPDWNNRL